MEYTVKYNKATGEAKIIGDIGELRPRFTELFEDYTEALLADFDITFTVHELDRYVVFKDNNTNQTSRMDFNKVTPETMLIWVHNVAAMLEIVRYDEIVDYRKEG